MPLLSVVVPGRCEVFHALTCKHVLEQARGDTECIAVVDGREYTPQFEEHPRLKVIQLDEPMGQRAATNIGIGKSDSKFVAKLDAHCAVDEGFDLKVTQDCQPDWVMIPNMHNLHAWDWLCQKCGHREYQGTKPRKCEKCSHPEFEMDMIWKPRPNRLTVSWRFDSELMFSYWKAHSKRPEVRNNQLYDTMACIGAYFFCERDYFWNTMGGMDEMHGSWGQYGVELALKAHTSGGRLIGTKKTHISHLFRTGNFARDGGSSWPYPIDSQQIDRARAYSRDLWRNGKWPGQRYPLSWVVERYWPIDGWSDADLAAQKAREAGRTWPGLQGASAA